MWQSFTKQATALLLLPRFLTGEVVLRVVHVKQQCLSGQHGHQIVAAAMLAGVVVEVERVEVVVVRVVGVVEMTVDTGAGVVGAREVEEVAGEVIEAGAAGSDSTPH